MELQLRELNITGLKGGTCAGNYEVALVRRKLVGTAALVNDLKRAALYGQYVPQVDSKTD
jgi:hypothetical protein